MSAVRQPQVRVHVDRAGQDEHPGRVDGLSAVGQVRTDALDAAVDDGNVRLHGALGSDDGSSRDDEVGHGLSRPR